MHIRAIKPLRNYLIWAFQCDIEAQTSAISLCSCVSSIKSISCSSISNVRPRCDYPGIRLLSARFSLSLYLYCARVRSCVLLKKWPCLVILSGGEQKIALIWGESFFVWLIGNMIDSGVCLSDWQRTYKMNNSHSPVLGPFSLLSVSTSCWTGLLCVFALHQGPLRHNLPLFKFTIKCATREWVK